MFHYERQKYNILQVEPSQYSFFSRFFHCVFLLLFMFLFCFSMSDCYTKEMDVIRLSDNNPKLRTLKPACRSVTPPPAGSHLFHWLFCLLGL